MRKLAGLIILIAGFAQAQELDTVALDTAKKLPPPYYGAIYVDAMVHIGPNLAGLNISSAVGFGVQYEKWTLGFSQFNFQGADEGFIIFPNLFELDYRYGGPQIGYAVHQSEWIRGQLQLSYYWGDMLWREKETKNDFLRDEFTMISVASRIELNKIRYAKPYFIVGYQQLNDLSLAATNNEDFSGVFFGLGIRIGYFNQ